jgi:hypothetical protein
MFFHKLNKLIKDHPLLFNMSLLLYIDCRIKLCIHNKQVKNKKHFIKTFKQIIGV